MWKKLGTYLSFSSAYHPQTDGHTEVVNRSLGNILRILVGERPKEWDQALPQAEFSYNNSPNRNTGQNPFHSVYGMHLRGIYEILDLGRDERRSAYGEDIAIAMHEVHEHVKLKLQDNTIKSKGREDLKRREHSFEVGELVLEHLRMETFPRGEYNKLKYNKIGLCNILRKFSNNAYELELPSGMAIYPIFNVAYLYKYKNSYIT